MNGRLYGAIEAGGTKFVCAVADASGRLVAETRVATTTPVTTLAAVIDFFALQLAPHGALAAIGIASFGPLSLQRSGAQYGQLLATPKAGWSHTDLVTPFVNRFNCRVAIDTDVNAAALAEARHGAAQGCDPVVYITVGTGIGGGVVVNGSPLHGALHPEMGHIRVIKHPRDHAFTGICPFHGDCLEGLASGPAIKARYGAELHALPHGHEAVDVIAHYLAQLAANSMLMLSPQRIIFGGGVLDHPGLLPKLCACTAALLNGYAGLGVSADALARSIVSPGLGQRSGLLGALELARTAAP